MTRLLLPYFSALIIGALCFAAVSQAQEGSQGTLLDLWADVAPRELSDKEFSDVLSIMKEFDEKDVDLNIDDQNGLPSKDAQLAAVKANPEAVAILAKHGYSPDSMYPVMINAVIAFGAAEMSDHKPEMAQAMAQLQAMKGQIPDEQYNMMMKQFGGGVDAMNRVPPANIVLAKKYRTQFDEIADD